ncbi:predicted protein [Plenodomus lingam JN3]|uniref:Predicted protein n=1 Tax=Leptosphaeria maculans (strain JN3 / isolate v23.1.3 / race Av1-4-5-6-7-8) TaxID=985895 RepID=E4ZRD2_LEPMJ|nr:predicted protein [Plenodomus lingam JN3]CBX93797.1 predicted protein [Plenodomus lingam JN3]
MRSPVPADHIRQAPSQLTSGYKHQRNLYIEVSNASSGYKFCMGDAGHCKWRLCSLQRRLREAASCIVSPRRLPA